MYIGADGADDAMSTALPPSEDVRETVRDRAGDPDVPPSAPTRPQQAPARSPAAKTAQYDPQGIPSGLYNPKLPSNPKPLPGMATGNLWPSIPWWLVGLLLVVAANRKKR